MMHSRSVKTMRVLVLSNLYPPHHIGGYELGCRDVVEGLRERGHDVRVLTSTYNLDGPRQHDGVYRWLDIDSYLNDHTPTLTRLLKKEVRNRQSFKHACNALRPDLVYVWNATHISVSNILMAQRMRLPVCYFVSDHWLSKWETDAWYSLPRRRPGRFHRRVAWRAFSPLLQVFGPSSRERLDLRHTQFASRFLKGAALEAGKPVETGEVIHWGVDTEKFSFNEGSNNCARLLYVGQVASHKGVETAIESLKLICEQPQYEAATLTVVGGPDYGSRAARLASELGLGEKVRFTGMIARERLPEIYRAHDVLVFPSVWDEPFSITLLEAMASGLAVVSTNTGGSPEILSDEVNALIFPKKDARACSRQIIRLLEDRQLFERIRRNGRRIVEGQFRLERMIDQIESSLLKAYGRVGVGAFAA